MIFRDREEVQQFLIEIGKVNEVQYVRDKDYNPTDEEMTSFIKSRGSIVPKLKSFRKSQNGKENWRKNRYSMMAGIKKWHSSTSGKRFHRALGRYNATRDYGPRDRREESFTEANLIELVETLKGLSSIVTHLFIELDYYHPIDEQVDLELLVDEAHPVIRRIEENLLKLQSVHEDDLDLLLRLLDPHAMSLELANFYKKPVIQVEEMLITNIKLLEVDNLYYHAYENVRYKCATGQM